MNNKAEAADLFETWLLKYTDLRPRSQAEYTRLIKEFFASEMSFRDFIQKLIEEGKIAKASTARAAGKAFDDFSKGKYPRLVDETVRKPKVRFKDPRHQEALTIEEVDALIGVMAKRYKRVAVALMAYGGLRIDEVLNLKMGDVQMKEGKIKVIGKGLKGRTVYIQERLRPQLKYWIEFRKHLIPNDEGAPFLSSSKTKAVKPTPNPISSEMKVAAKKIGMTRNIHCHLLRKTYAVLLYKAGNDILTIARQLGHSNIKTTVDKYLIGEMDDVKQI